MPIGPTVLSKYPNTIFIETGTYMGATTALALGCGFERVLTVELSDHWRDLYQNLFGKDDRVQLFAGSSTDRLPQMLAQVDAPATFWLDAHYYPWGPSALGDKYCPLLEELDHIAGHWIKTHTLLIDDVRCFGKEFGPEITVEQVIKKLLAINPEYRFHFEHGRERNDILVAAPPPPLKPKMGITAYPLSNHAVAIMPRPRPAPGGWDLLAPYAFEATWNGGPSPEDIDIRIETPDMDAPAFVQSFLGHGILTFHPGYQLKTGADQTLWVRGPVNLPKDGLYPLEHLVDAAVLPCTVTIHWQCTRPDHTIRFTAGEPFATLLLCPKSAPEKPTLDVVQPDADPDVCELAFQELAGSEAVENVFRRMAGR